MTPEEIKKFEEKQLEQERALSEFDSEKCISLKNHLEETHALYVLRKEIIPFTRWYFENIKDSTIQIDLVIGDSIEHIELEQSFSFKNEYKGTIRSTIIEISPSYIKLMTPDRTNYLITEGCKAFTIIKPIYEKEFDVQERMIALMENQNAKKSEPLTFDQIKTLVIIVLSIISILIFGSMMVF